MFVYDLINHMRRDENARKRVTEAVAHMERVITLTREGKANRTDLVRAMSAMVPVCGFNFGLLIPYFFHRYPVDLPLSLLARPFMFAMTCLVPDSITTLMAGRQVGKCAAGDTEVTTNEGTLTLRQLFQTARPV